MFEKERIKVKDKLELATERRKKAEEAEEKAKKEYQMLVGEIVINEMEETGVSFDLVLEEFRRQSKENKKILGGQAV